MLRGSLSRGSPYFSFQASVGKGTSHAGSLIFLSTLRLPSHSTGGSCYGCFALGTYEKLWVDVPLSWPLQSVPPGPRVERLHPGAPIWFFPFEHIM